MKKVVERSKNKEIKNVVTASGKPSTNKAF